MTLCLLDLPAGGVKRAEMGGHQSDENLSSTQDPFEEGLAIQQVIEKREFCRCCVPLTSGVAGGCFLTVRQDTNNKTEANRCAFFEQIFILGKLAFVAMGYSSIVEKLNN